jgi:DNA sulfur modification protein DndB
MDTKKIEKRDYGREFEEEVRAFLEEKLHFSDVKGGPDFHIAAEGEKNQIDACGRFKDILFVFECKASGRRTKKNLRQDIHATINRAGIVWKNYKNIPEYSHCKFVKFIFITKKIEIPESEREMFKNTHVWYADHELLEYYSDLYEKIGEYAIYNFLADYGIQPATSEQLKVTALRTNLGKYKVYSFYAHPKELLKFAYVARRRSLKENFYQRMLDKSRIKKIQYFLDGGGIFPTNIILSLKEGEKTFEKSNCSTASKDSEVGILTIKNNYAACWIIDGQHRLYSFARSKSDVLIPCIAFDEIDIDIERRFFLEINREQRPIQPDLIWDLEGLANPDSPRGIISNIVRTLNNREPFLDKIYIPVKGSKIDKLVNMAAFCNGLVNASLTKQITPNCLGIKNPLFTEITKTMTNRSASVLERYFTLLSESFKDGYKDFIFGNAGIPIMLYVFEPILSRIARIPSFNDIQQYTDAIVDFFELNYSDAEAVKVLKTESLGEGSRRRIARQIGLHIRKKLSDNDFWPKMEQAESMSEIRDMERRMANLISVKLSSITTGWEKQRIPQSIYQVAKKRMEKDETRFDQNLDLGDELQIILQKNNWEEVFERVFIKKDGFLDQKELELAFRYLSMIRNPAAHGKSVMFSKEDLDQCAIYLQKLSRVVPEIIDEYSDTSDDLAIVENNT